MSTTQDGGRRPAMSYFRYASLVTDALAAETAETAEAAEAAVEWNDRTTSVGEAADAAGLTTALWRAAHALSPAAAAVTERPAGVAGPYSATAAGEAAPPTGGAGHLDRRG